MTQQSAGSSDSARDALLSRFRELAQKLADERDPEIRAIYKKRLLDLAPQLTALGAPALNLSQGNFGITVQDSDVRDVIQFIVQGGPAQDSGERGLRDSYLSALVARLNRVRLIGGEEWAERVRLSGVYTALLTDARPDKVATRQEDDAKHEAEREPVPVLQVLNAERALVLLGGPGSGKSTFANFVAMCMGGQWLGLQDVNLNSLTAGETEAWTHGALLPVIIELREFAAQLPTGPIAPDALWTYITSTLAPADYAKPLLKALAAEGGLFLLDGLDEVPEAHARRAQVKQAVQMCVTLFPKCRFLVTSRTYAYQQQGWRLDGFAEAVLRPFSDEQKAAFVDAWYDHIARIKPLNPDDARGRAFSLKARSVRDERLSEIAERPLLLTLIARLHLNSGVDLPSEREPIYDASVKMLLSDWESEKVRKRADGSGYEIIQPSLSECLKLGSSERLRPALQRLAYDAHARQGELRGPANISQELVQLALIRLVREQKGVEVNPLVLEDFLRDRAGILVAHGEGVYQFPHRTFQEYLAARHLIEERAFPDDLAELVKTDLNRWREATQLAAARMATTSPSAFWDLIGALISFEPPESPSVTMLNGALMAGQALLETGLASRTGLLERHAERRARVQRWMRHIIERGLLVPADRLIAGDALSELRDDRMGVSVVNGIPDIVWCTVPDDGPFLYGEDKQPRRIGTFRIAKYPVTNAQFKAFEDAPDGWVNDMWWVGLAAGGDGREQRPAYFKGANRPRENVSWYGAVAFTRWLTAQLRQAGKLGLAEVVTLPTKMQWEKAARGVDGREYPWGNNYEAGRANIDETESGNEVGPNYLQQTSAVGMYPYGLSPYGLHDCAGNVWEWCLTAYNESKNTSVRGDARRVLRGGSWHNNRMYARCTIRHDLPNLRLSYFGFRCCVASPSSPQEGL